MGRDLGRVCRLSVTPIKGCRMHHPGAIDLGPFGAIGDRELFVVDEADKVVSIHHTGAMLPLRSTFDPETAWLELHTDDGAAWCGIATLGEPLSANFYGVRTVEG